VVLKLEDEKMNKRNVLTMITPLFLAFSLAFSSLSAQASEAQELEQEADMALKLLLGSEPAAKKLASTAKGILVFPDVIKAGFLIGGQYGNGVLTKAGKTAGYYNTTAASYGLQAGAQKFDYVMMFMTDSALDYLESSSGWEVGIGPSLVVVDEGIAKSLTTTTEKDDIYVFFFGQKGLMAGLGIQGSKISKITPDK
jgi:lipid-binding SYLF domain-containing protein